MVQVHFFNGLHRKSTQCQQYLTSDLTNKIARWLVNQQWGQWWSLGYTQRQARELISGPCLGTKARLFSFNLLAPEFGI
jgi:hypothetical protein